MDTIEARAHHVEILRKLIEGKTDPSIIRENYPKSGHPLKLADSFIDDASILKKVKLN